MWDVTISSNLCSMYIGFMLAVSTNVWGSIAYLGAGLAAIGCIGSGIGQGFIGGKSVEAIGRNPEVENKIRTQMIISAAITESGAIYALVIAIILMFVVAGDGKPTTT